MFKDIVGRLQSEFLAKQMALINGRNGNFKALVDGIPKLPDVSFGEPPYIVDDGEDALLLIDADGSYSRLPPDFYLSEKSVNENYDSLYSVPSMSTGQVIRLIPANSNYDFSETQATVSEPDNDYYGSLDRLFDHYIKVVIDLTRRKAAKELMRRRLSLLKACEENDTNFADILKDPDISRALYSIFSHSLVDASEESIQTLCDDEDLSPSADPSNT